jgi:hypothetical protein
VTARGSRFEGFAHALFGGITRKVEDLDSDTEFEMGFGGGVDVKFGDHFAVRLVQLDYFRFAIATFLRATRSGVTTRAFRSGLRSGLESLGRGRGMRR